MDRICYVCACGPDMATVPAVEVGCEHLATDRLQVRRGLRRGGRAGAEGAWAGDVRWRR